MHIVWVQCVFKYGVLILLWRVPQVELLVVVILILISPTIIKSNAASAGSQHKAALAFVQLAERFVI